MSGIVIIGQTAGFAMNNAGANYTTGIGFEVFRNLTSGQGNTAIGKHALYAEDDGDFNTAVGFEALKDQTGISGTVGNTAVGYHAATNITTGYG